MQLNNKSLILLDNLLIQGDSPQTKRKNKTSIRSCGKRAKLGYHCGYVELSV